MERSRKGDSEEGSVVSEKSWNVNAAGSDEEGRGQLI